MIFDGILLLFQGILNIILFPLGVLNIGIDFLSFPIVTQFLQIVAYILPWNNLLPLITLLIGISVFKIGVILSKTIIHFIPFY